MSAGAGSCGGHLGNTEAPESNGARDGGPSISIIIPTYNRAKELHESLQSILLQTRLPIDVVIVDDSTNSDVGLLMTEEQQSFKKRNVDILYLRNKDEKSAGIARNFGVDYAKGDIILFLDDDVLLDINYIQELTKVYLRNPDSKGAQGYWAFGIRPNVWERLYNTLCKTFLLMHFSEDRCEVLRSFHQTYPWHLTREITCQWLSGCNQSFTRKILEEYRYDVNLKRYSLGEDIDISYRISKQYPESLIITPKARLIHKAAMSSKPPAINLYYIQYSYQYYLFRKNMDYTAKNRLAYAWSILGGFLLSASSACKQHRSRPSGSAINRIKHMLTANYLVFKKRKSIRKGDFTSISEFLEY